MLFHWSNNRDALFNMILPDRDSLVDKVFLSDRENGLKIDYVDLYGDPVSLKSVEDYVGEVRFQKIIDKLSEKSSNWECKNNIEVQFFSKVLQVACLTYTIQEHKY
jgi:hypothetical protein